MLSSTSADVNSNVNLVYADVIQVNIELLGKSDDPELFKGWRNWSPQDIIRILKDMAKPGETHLLAAVVKGNIVLRKLLEAAVDPNVPFEVIEEIVYTALEAPVYAGKYDVLNGFSIFNRRAVCAFFKEFVKRGIDDARYYNLIYMMLTYRLNGGFPLGFEMGKKDEFNDEVLVKLPLEM